MRHLEPIVDLLAASSPLRDAELETPSFAELLADVGAAARVEAGRTTARRTGRRRRVAATVTAVVAVSVAVSQLPAAADWVSLQTGRHELGSPWHPQPTTPDNELWRADSPDLRPRLEEFARDYPLAPGIHRGPADPYAGRALPHPADQTAGSRRGVLLQRVHLGRDVAPG